MINLTADQEKTLPEEAKLIRSFMRIVEAGHDEKSAS